MFVGFFMVQMFFHNDFPCMLIYALLQILSCICSVCNAMYVFISMPVFVVVYGHLEKYSQCLDLLLKWFDGWQFMSYPNILHLTSTLDFV